MTQLWERVILSPEYQAYFDAQNSIYSGKDIGLFTAKYYRWLAVDGSQLGSPQLVQAKEDALAALKVCLANDQFDSSIFTDELKRVQIPTEAIQEWIAAEGK